MEYQKVKSAGKRIEVDGPQLKRIVLQTMKIVSQAVGATLGPGGKPVLLERYESGLPPIPTKDGVTVYRSIGFRDAAMQIIMETQRDAAVRTASEAGDGTTTATILSEAIVRNLFNYCETHERVSPQRVVRHLEDTFKTVIEPIIKKLSRKAQLDTVRGNKLLKAVATISANGDTAMAEKVLECFQITGDEGNVTIVEKSGRSGYDVEKIDGYTVNVGYEDSCGRYYPSFINEVGTQRTVMAKPIFLLYHGRISEIQTIEILMGEVGERWGNDKSQPHNVVIAATGFSDSVLAHLALNFSQADCINVFPLEVPLTPQANGQLQFLQDLEAVTGAKVLDPITSPIEQATIDDLGPGVKAFESTRFRSSIIGHADVTLLEMRIDQLDQLLQSGVSDLEAFLLRERKAKLSSGIAKFWVSGASNGELKEKRDRVEDAVCAVRGAIKAGVLPGGAWTLLKIIHDLPRNEINDEVLRPALMEPFKRLVSNCGIVDLKEREDILAPIMAGIDTGKPVVYDFLNQKHVDPYKGGILDSTPAVLEAIRNSISIASQGGTLGGLIAFERDEELERQEARGTAQFLRDGNVNEADQRP